MKMILIAVLTVAVGAGVVWAAPSNSSVADTVSAGQKVLYYTCPMHPSVKEEKPGDCPICGMHLVPVYDSGSATGTNAVVKTNSPPVIKTDSTAALPSCCGVSCPLNPKP